jgi:hypothetical protein
MEVLGKGFLFLHVEDRERHPKSQNLAEHFTRLEQCFQCQYCLVVTKATTTESCGGDTETTGHMPFIMKA